MSAGVAHRDDALAAVDENCPRCGSPRYPNALYCASCGLRLPIVHGTVPALRRRWLHRIGWYPGDWVWMMILTFAVAVAGAASSIAITRHRLPRNTPTFVATGPATTVVVTSVATTTVTTAQTTTTTGGGGKPRKPPVRKPKPPLVKNGRLHWPGTNGWTVILGSFPIPRFRPAARTAATQAAQRGLHQVGMLDSSKWASLNPGYDVVFSGIYGTAAEAEAALARVRHAGFGGAYPRQIAR